METAERCKFLIPEEMLLNQPTCGSCGLGLYGRNVVFTVGCHHNGYEWIPCCEGCGNELWEGAREERGYPTNPETRSAWDLAEERSTTPLVLKGGKAEVRSPLRRLWDLFCRLMDRLQTSDNPQIQSYYRRFTPDPTHTSAVSPTSDRPTLQPPDSTSESR